VKLKPTAMVEAVWMISPEKLRQRGIRSVLFDLDNTVVDWNQEHVRPEVLEWANQCREAGLTLCICTNAHKKPRIERIAQQLGASYVATAGKPGVRGYRAALELVGCTPQEAVMIGDQVFTDIWGANRAGLATILVRPLCTRDFPATKITRFFERRVLRRWSAAGRTFLKEL
jgi:uncharacterized protein